MPERCQQPRCAFRDTLVALATSACTRGITRAFPAKRGASEGQPEKEAGDLPVPRRSSDGLQGVALPPPLTSLCKSRAGWCRSTTVHVGAGGAAGTCPAANAPLALLETPGAKTCPGSAASSGRLLPCRHNNARRTGCLCPLPGPPFPLASPVAYVPRRAAIAPGA